MPRDYAKVLANQKAMDERAALLSQRQTVG
jgi:hypothetical protein